MLDSKEFNLSISLLLWPMAISYLIHRKKYMVTWYLKL